MDGDRTDRGIWRFGQVVFDGDSGRLTVGGRPADIDRSSQALLAALLEKVDAPLSKDELLEIGWPGRLVHENSLAKAVGRLRQALCDEGRRIEAVYGSGYRLVGPVRHTPGRASPLPATGGPLARGWRRLFGSRDRRWGTAAMLVATLALVVAGWSLWRGAAEREQASRRERQVESLLTFLSADLLAAADPYSTAYREATVREAVERTAATVDHRLRDDPATRAVLHRMVANAFSGWGEYEKAVSHLDRAQRLNTMLYGPLARDNVPVDIALCQNLRLGGETRRAERICLRAEQVARASASPLLGAARIVRAKLQFEIGEYDAAATALAAVLANDATLPRDERADAEWFQALALRKLADYPAADAAFRRHLALRQSGYGDRHPLTAWAHADYGDFLVATGDFAKADRHLGRAQQIFDAALGPAHPESLSPAYSRAVADLWQGRSAAARDRLRPILARYRETLGADHYWTLYTMTELAIAEAREGQHAAAEELLREARQTGARVLYGREGKAAHFHMRWARALAVLGKPDEADDEIRRAREAIERSGFGADHPWRAQLHCLSARSALARGAARRAESEAQNCLAGLAAVDALPATYPSLIEARRMQRRNISSTS